MPIQKTLSKGKVPVKIYTQDIDPLALQQLYNMAQLPFIHSHIAAMPDVHAGKGATVGSVIPTKGAIIPAAVGVDIGCGMNAVRLTLTAEQLPDNLRAVRSAIESAIPVGFNQHKKDMARDSTIRALAPGLSALIDMHPKLHIKKHRAYQTWVRQLGTLGGGNHFIEVCLDEDQAVWIMLHSGSRGIGNNIGQYFIEKAKVAMGKALGKLPDKDLAFLMTGDPLFEDYLMAVEWAQEYARINRQEMMRLVINALQKKLPPFKLTKEAINCHHNYIARETHYGEKLYVTRKGAISAQAGELGIIPGSMGAKSYIVRGKGAEQSFCSCSHGAGRRMSRTQAKNRFSQQDAEVQTQGIECRKDKGILDELPQAYKDIDEVMENQSDLVEVVHTLRQVVCVKG